MSDTKITLLLVEDEIESADLLADFLEMNDFYVLKAYDGKQAMTLIDEHADKIDLAILDIMVPYINGREICNRIRKHPVLTELPIIFLTAKDQEKDEIEALNMGGDDYISKPAGFTLILARINTLLRRKPKIESSWFSYNGITLNSDTKEVYSGNRSVDLTATEFQLLQILIEQPKRVFSRQEILEKISTDDHFIFDRTVDVHIKNMRIKLKDYGDAIKTYRGLGYGMNKEFA